MEARKSSSLGRSFSPVGLSGCAGTGHPEGISERESLANTEGFLWRAEGQGVEGPCSAAGTDGVSGHSVLPGLVQPWLEVPGDSRIQGFNAAGLLGAVEPGVCL